MMNKLIAKFNAHRRKYVIISLAVAAVIITVVLYNIPSSPLQKIVQKKPNVQIKTSYKNPFDKNTQYMNPFEKYKNPFVANR